MGEKLSKAQNNEYSAIFEKFDQEKNEYLSEEELKDFVVGWADLYVFQKLDKNKDGKIDIEEFKKYLMKRKKEIKASLTDGSNKELNIAFNHDMAKGSFLQILDKEFEKLDQDKDKALDPEELRRWTGEWAHKYIFQKINKDQNNAIDRKEFLDYIEDHLEELEDAREKGNIRKKSERSVGAPPPEAGAPPPEAGAPPPEAEAPPPEAGAPPPEAGALPPEAEAGGD